MFDSASFILGIACLDGIVTFWGLSDFHNQLHADHNQSMRTPNANGTTRIVAALLYPCVSCAVTTTERSHHN